MEQDKDKGLALCFEVEHDHSNGHTMTMRWQHGIKLVTQFEPKPARCWLTREGSADKVVYPLQGMEVERFMALQEQCQQYDNELARFDHEPGVN